MNKPLTKEQTDALKVIEPTQYEKFQSKFKELCQYTLAKTDELIDLMQFTKETLCGTACCIAGNLPELWPYEFIMTELPSGQIGPASVEFPRYGGVDAIYALMDASQEDLDTYPDIDELFFSNMSVTTFLPKSDREVIEERMELVAKCSSFEQLNESLFSGSYKYER